MDDKRAALLLSVSPSPAPASASAFPLSQNRLLAMFSSSLPLALPVPILRETRAAPPNRRPLAPGERIIWTAPTVTEITRLAATSDRPWRSASWPGARNRARREPRAARQWSA